MHTVKYFLLFFSLILSTGYLKAALILENNDKTKSVGFTKQLLSFTPALCITANIQTDNTEFIVKKTDLLDKFSSSELSFCGNIMNDFAHKYYVAKSFVNANPTECTLDKQIRRYILFNKLDVGNIVDLLKFSISFSMEDISQSLSTLLKEKFSINSHSNMGSHLVQYCLMHAWLLDSKYDQCTKNLLAVNVFDSNKSHLLNNFAIISTHIKTDEDTLLNFKDKLILAYKEDESTPGTVGYIKLIDIQKDKIIATLDCTSSAIFSYRLVKWNGKNQLILLKQVSTKSDLIVYDLKTKQQKIIMQNISVAQEYDTIKNSIFMDSAHSFFVMPCQDRFCLINLSTYNQTPLGKSTYISNFASSNNNLFAISCTKLIVQLAANDEITIIDHDTSINSFGISLDEKIICFITEDDRTLWIWNAYDKSKRKVTFQESIYSLSTFSDKYKFVFSKDNSLLFVLGENRLNNNSNLIIIDVETAKVVLEKTLGRIRVNIELTNCDNVVISYNEFYHFYHEAKNTIVLLSPAMIREEYCNRGTVSLINRALSILFRNPLKYIQNNQSIKSYLNENDARKYLKLLSTSQQEYVLGRGIPSKDKINKKNI